MNTIQKTVIIAMLYIGAVSSSAAQGIALREKIAISGNPALINADINLTHSTELYLDSQTDCTLILTGNFCSENGSKIFLSANSGYIGISGTATGKTEIIPELPVGWDGSRIDCIKAKLENSVTDAFQMQGIEADGYLVQLKHETRDSSLVWYIEKTEINSCLPLIFQLGNHTLLVNNNSKTNGGHRFVYYFWYKNGQLIKEGSHADNGGSYYTGGAYLDEKAEYTVIAIDSTGKKHISCPYRFIHLSTAISIKAYPNPVPLNARAYIKAETQDISLLQDAVVEIYDIFGQYIGKSAFKGQKLISIDLPDKQGVYILKFRSKDFYKIIKLAVK
jgi:hypothetical protein